MFFLVKFLFIVVYLCVIRKKNRNLKLWFDAIIFFAVLQLLYLIAMF